MQRILFALLAVSMLGLAAGCGTAVDGQAVAATGSAKLQVLADGVVQIGEGKTTLDFFEDPRCPICGQFEQRDGQAIAKAIDDGKIAVRYHLMDFLNRVSTTKYSTRAVAATLCVADTGDGGQYTKFHTALFGDQPAEDATVEPTNDELAAKARSAGVSDAVAECVSAGKKMGDAAAATAASHKALTDVGGKGTPTIANGSQIIDWSDEQWLNSLP